MGGDLRTVKIIQTHPSFTG